MARKVSFSGENLSLEQATIYHQDVDRALRLFFSNASPTYAIRFAGYRTVEVNKELNERIIELDRNTTVSLLSAIEAAFRIDYLQRCYRKEKDDISRDFLEIYKEKQAHVSLDEIFEIWKDRATGSAKLIGELRGAFNFRHWIAHGRYWTPKLGRKYDYLSVYPLARQILTFFPLMKP